MLTVVNGRGGDKLDVGGQGSRAAVVSSFQSAIPSDLHKVL